VLICEHASRFIPDDFGNLGLSEDALRAHIAWDIGALDVARELSLSLDAPLVYGGVSRLLYDCNRPFSAPDCIPEVSEVFQIPGNTGLTDNDRASRDRTIHQPFHLAVEQLILSQAARTESPLVIVTVHSFTPEYNGVPRKVELGFIHHDNADLSQRCVNIEIDRGRYKAALNEPYNASQGVTYSLQRHADKNDYPSTMIEISNTLIDEPSKALAMAEHLAGTLRTALDSSKRDSA